MVLVKFTGPEAELALAASRAIQQASKEENKHKKAREAGREVLARLLAKERDVFIDQLPPKTVIMVQCDGADAVKIEIKAQDRFDSKAFSLVHPDLALKFTRETPTVYCDSLLPS